MRLINAKTLQLKDFVGDSNIPRYAILSHTWGPEEITLQEWDDPRKDSKAGYQKIKYCCDQAVKDGLEWCWVDT